MRENANLVLTGERVILVPYRPEHVPLYHFWMVESPPPPPGAPPGGFGVYHLWNSPADILCLAARRSNPGGDGVRTPHLRGSMLSPVMDSLYAQDAANFSRPEQPGCAVYMQEEYSMQRSWAEDDDSALQPVSGRPYSLCSVNAAAEACASPASCLAECTFIVLDRSLPDTSGTGQHGGGKCSKSPPLRLRTA
jgi:hypothetical protein